MSEIDEDHSLAVFSIRNESSKAGADPLAIKLIEADSARLGVHLDTRELLPPNIPNCGIHQTHTPVKIGMNESNGSLRRRKASPDAFEDERLLPSDSARDYIFDDAEKNVPSSLINCLDNVQLTLMDEIILLGLRDQKGYLSFTNDSISYVLRGCLLMELALIGRIKAERCPKRGSSFSERVIRIVDASPTNEVLLDETIRILQREEHSIGGWLDLLSGETWNPLKASLQIKNVRQRVAKGLVDKGVLRTDRQSFILFDMATHPVASLRTKNSLCKRIINTCMGRGPIPTLRSVTVVVAALSANIIDFALQSLPPSDRTSALNRAEELLRIYSGPCERNTALPAANVVIAGVFSVFSRLDTIVY